MTCSCAEPKQAADPRHGSCLRCCMAIEDGPGISTEATVKEFFDRLEDGIFKFDADAKERRFFHSVRALCEYREQEGKDKFGLGYLDRDNVLEANEEGADFINYLYMADLKTFRATGEHVDLDVLLTGAKLIVEGMEMVAGYSAKLRGSP